MKELNMKLPCSFGKLIQYQYQLNRDVAEFCKKNQILLKGRDKGNVGKMIEFHIFGRLPNNDSAPDLGDRDIKTTHIKKLQKGGWNAKERLTLTNCGSTSNYLTLQHFLTTEKLEASTLFPKIRKGILFVFRHDKTITDIYDEIVDSIIEYDILQLPDEVKNTIYEDYAKIQACVRDQTVSQKGQRFLHIHPHGSKGSKTRALGFTNKFVTFLICHYTGRPLNKNGISWSFT
jgi:hypothetical protein